MLLNEKDELTYRLWLLFLTAAGFVLYLYIALHLPTTSDFIPDEKIRKQIPIWIAEHLRLPTGYEVELNSASSYGFSYASYMPLPSLLAFFPVYFVSAVTSSVRAITIACRIPSIIAGTLSIVFLMKLGKQVFRNPQSAALFTLFVAFTPQVVFLNSYYNADSISLLTVIMILYYTVKGKNDGWDKATCAKLALSMSFCVLTYYNAYGWCLVSVLFCVCNVLFDKGVDRKEKLALILHRGLLIASIILVMTGWAFIRNAVLYHGDFLAIRFRDAMARETAALGYPVRFQQPFYGNGKGPIRMLFDKDGWIELTVKSVFGLFGGMDIFLPNVLYVLYIGIFSVGIFFFILRLFKKKQDVMFYLALLLGCIITVGLSFFYSYKVDYQPQGRYIISALPAAALFAVTGYQSIEGKNDKSFTVSEFKRKTLSYVWGCLLVAALFSTVIPCVLTQTTVSCKTGNGSDYLELSCSVEETVQPDAVQYAIWNPKNDTAAIWYDAEFNGKEWVVDYQIPQTENDELYFIHIYGIVNGKLKQLTKTRMTLNNGLAELPLVLDN